VTSNPSDSEAGPQTAPVEPPDMGNPLAPFVKLVVPAMIAVVVIWGLFFGVIPTLQTVTKAREGVGKIGEDAAKSYTAFPPTATPAMPVYTPPPVWTPMNGGERRN